LISHDSIVPPIRELVGGQARLFRADALMKPPVVGSVKGVHQDSPYWPIRPMSLWSCWIPFDDATVDNGCLTVISGSHRGGGREHVAVENDYVIPPEQYGVEELLPVPMERGTAIFFHSLLIHGSLANHSGLPRRAVTMSYFGPGHRDVTAGEPRNYPLVG
jgi:ectoine hydroxylase-related dioxygenase (phytanoyl-CoA dioxygenase family)